MKRRRRTSVIFLWVILLANEMGVPKYYSVQQMDRPSSLILCPSFRSLRINWKTVGGNRQMDLLAKHTQNRGWGREGEGRAVRARGWRRQSQFLHSCFCERFIYSHAQSVCLFCCRKIGGPILGIFIDRSKTHECAWKLGLRPRNSFSGNT